MLDFQEQTQLIDSAKGVQTLNFTFTFDSVVRYVTIAIKSFELHFVGDDHHIENVQINTSVESDYRPFTKTVDASVSIYLRDKDGNSFGGAVTVVAIVDREPTWIRLLSEATNQYVCAENGGGGVVNANRPSASVWETFSLEGPLQYDELVSFKTFDGIHYLQAPEDGSKAFTANGTWPKELERFAIIPIDLGVDPSLSGDQIPSHDSPVTENSRILLQAHNGMYVTVDPATKKVNVNASSPTKNGVFKVHLP